MKSKLPTDNPVQSTLSEEWLDKALADNADVFKFTTPSPNDPISTINLSMFGLHNANDVKAFLLSPAGDTVKHEISTHVAMEQSLLESIKFDLMQEELRRQQLKALLSKWLHDKSKDSAHKIRGLIEEQNEHVLKQIKNNAEERQKSATAEAKRSADPLVASYERAIKSCRDEQNALIKEEKSLSDLLRNLRQEKADMEAKHAAYTKSLRAFEREIEKHEKSSDKELEKSIEKLEQQLQKQTDKIAKALEKGDEKTAHKLLKEQNALSLQAAILDDIKAVREGKKMFYNAEGKPVGSLKEATYVVSNKDQLIIEGDKKYLLPAGTKLTDDNREQAEERFKRSEPELLIVKESVASSKQQEEQSKDGQINEASQKHDKIRSQQLMLENQITRLQKAHVQSQQQTLAKSAPITPSYPSSQSVSMSAPISVSQPVASFYSKCNALLSMPQITPELINYLIEREVPEGPQREEVKKHFNDTYQLDKVAYPSAPLPDATMNSLRQHLEQYGSVTEEKKDSEQQHVQEDTQHGLSM